MRPALLALAIAFATPAAAETAQQVTLLPGKMPSLSQGRPSQGQAATRFAPAPLPNPDLTRPSERDPNAVQVMPSLTPTPGSQSLSGSGHTPGSAFSGHLDRRGRNSSALGSTVAPSLSLRVPLTLETQ